MKQEAEEVELVFLDGRTEIVSVLRWAMPRICPYCKEKFLTKDPDKTYCNRVHKQRAYENRKEKSLPTRN